ncbi:MAG: hypothetical protein HC868_18115 [Sphingomonadales bacterium]|nr:hypothetical protein [Sphingomonadales bacterium]
MLHRRFLSIVLLLFLVDWATPVDADGVKVNVQVTGSDGKPATGSKVRLVRYGDKTPVKTPPPGEIVEVQAIDSNNQTGSTVVFVPKTGTVNVVVTTGKPEPSYALHADNARKASAAGDLDTYNAEAFQASEAIDQERAQLANERQLVEQFKQQQYLPDLTAQEVGALIEKAKTQGFNSDSPSVKLLTLYKSYLTRLEDLEETVKRHEDDFKTLQPPDKRTSMAPGACPNGEGGLLAGWINSVTGSDLAAACDIDTKREKNKDRRDPKGDRDHHGHD